MAMSLLESIRKLIRQNTNLVGGPVGNLHGAVTSNLGELTLAEVQTWLSLDIPGSQLPDIAQFYQNYSVVGGKMVLLVAADGTVFSESAPGNIQLIRTTATIRQRTNFGLRVQVASPGGTCAVYVNGTLARRGSGTTTIPITLEAGVHEIAVLAVSTATTITAPGFLELDGEMDIPAKPTWVGVTTQYLDPTIGTTQNNLTWLSDPKVGGYYVLRRQRTVIQDQSEEASPTDATILGIGEIGADGAYAITLEGLHDSKLGPGTEVLADFDSLGVVVQVGSDNNGNTSVRLRTLPGTVLPSQDWVGRVVYVGNFTPITQIPRTTSAPTITYADSTVKFGEAYEYCLVAYGLLNPAVRSIRSDVQFVIAGDVQPPGPIVFDEGYPMADTGFVTARFTTPVDLDYAGVNVYWVEQVLNEAAEDVFVPYEVVEVAGRVITIDDPELPPGGLVGYKLNFGGGIVYTIEDNTAGTITVVEELLPEPEVGEELNIFRRVKVKTDYGLPNSKDELSFTATDIGLYTFCTFDRAGNEQSDSEAAQYTLTSLTGSGQGQPIVAFRQLLPSEQSYFAEPYNDSSSYALVELWAANTGVPISQKFAGVELFYRRRSDVSDRMIVPIPFSGEAFPWIVSGSGMAVLDAPDWVVIDPPPIVSGGTKSRFVSLERTLADNWVRVWAENAAGMSSDILTFVVDYDNTPEITSLETFIDNENNTASFQAVIDDDTQALTWFITEPDENEPSEEEPAHLGSTSVKTFNSGPLISLPLGKTKLLVVKPWGTWSTLKATITGVSGRTITCAAADFPTTGAGMKRYRVTWPATTRTYVVESNTATSFTVTTDFVTPLPVFGTEVHISFASGLEGEAVERYLTRTPRSFVAFENKNERGERDVTSVTAVFTQIPSPAVVAGETGTGTFSLSGGFKLTDGSKSWTPNEFSSAGTLAWYYVRATGSVSGKPMVRRIVANSATELFLEGGLISGTSLADFTAVPYQIIDGAVNVRKRGVTDDDDSTAGGFLPTAGRETYARADTFVLDYFATKNGCLAENLRSILVDPDTDSSLGSFDMTFNSTNNRLTCKVSEPDDDCKYWELYLKRGEWPTTNSPATADGAVDPRFLRYVSSDVSPSSLVFTQTVEAGNTWYGIAVPYNSLNQPGKRLTDSVVTTGGGPASDKLLSLEFRPQAGTSTAQVDVYAENGASFANFTITAYDKDDPANTFTDTDTFTLPIHGGDTYGMATLTGLPFTASSTTTTNRRTWVITVTSGARTPITIERSFYVEVGGTLPGSTPAVSAVTVTEYDQGYCPGDCGAATYRPLLLNVAWTLSNASALLYEVAVDMNMDGGSWVPVNWGMTLINGSMAYIHGFQCYTYNINGRPVDLQFRVRVVRKDTMATVASATSSVYATNIRLCEPGIGDI